MQIVIDGTTMDHRPTNYVPELIEFSKSKRNLDQSLSGQVLKLKYRFSLDNITITNWQTIMRMFSKRNATRTYRDGIDIAQTFNGDGSTVSFNLGRVCYTSATTAIAWIDNVQKSVTFTALTNPGATQVYINGSTGVVTCGATPSNSTDNLEIHYQPIYSVKLISPQLGYLPGTVYSYRAVFEEI